LVSALMVRASRKEKEMNVIDVPVEKCVFPTQPRSKKEPEYIRGLVDSIKAIGIQVPLLGWWEELFNLADGGCRLEAAKIAGLRVVPCVDLGKKPSDTELELSQAVVDVQKQHLPPVDRALLYRRLKASSGWTAQHIAGLMGISPSNFSRYLPLAELVEDVQGLVNAGTLEFSKATLIAQETSDPEKQRQLAQEAISMTRDGLREFLKGKPKKSKSKQFQIPFSSGLVVSVRRADFAELKKQLTELMGEIRKAESEKWDFETFLTVMNRKSKSKKPSEPGAAQTTV
jgi:ParB family transcriptional regulator, chromosome partitioning protein